MGAAPLCTAQFDSTLPFQPQLNLCETGIFPAAFSIVAACQSAGVRVHAWQRRRPCAGSYKRFLPDCGTRRTLARAGAAVRRHRPMYITKHYEETNLAVLHGLIDAHPLGAWVTTG